MSVFAVENDPPVTEQQIARIQQLWATRRLDTVDIAERVGLKEHQVYRLLNLPRGP